MLALLREGRHEPLVREAFAGSIAALEPGHAVQQFGPLPSGRDVPVGVGRVAVAADSTLGIAVSSTLPVERIPLTLSLHIDVVGPIPGDDEPLIAEARALPPAGSTLPATGEIRAADGSLVALASLRDIGLAARGRSHEIRSSRSASSAAESARTSEDRAGTEVHESAETSASDRGSPRRPDGPATAGEALGPGAPWPAMTDAAASSDGTTRASVPMTLSMANTARIVQGGVGLALCEELARRSLLNPLGDAEDVVPMTLTAHFVTGVPCDGSSATVEAVTLGRHGRTRRMQSSILLADSTAALVADIAYRLR